MIFRTDIDGTEWLLDTPLRMRQFWRAQDALVQCVMKSSDTIIKLRDPNPDNQLLIDKCNSVFADMYPASEEFLNRIAAAGGATFSPEQIAQIIDHYDSVLVVIFLATHALNERLSEDSAARPALLCWFENFDETHAAFKAVVAPLAVSGHGDPPNRPLH